MRAGCYVSVSTAVHSYGLNGKGSQAVEIYRRMPTDLMNERTHSCVLHACSHCGLLDQARQIFAEVPTKTDRIYTTMVRMSNTSPEQGVSCVLLQIDCLSRATAFDEARQLIRDYESRHPPSLVMHSEYRPKPRARSTKPSPHRCSS